MGLTFITRKYTCEHCGHTDKAYAVISRLPDIESYFTTENRPAVLLAHRLYIEVLERDESGLITKRVVEPYHCDRCNSVDVKSDHVDTFDNVLNFYPKGESSKWFEGFAKHM